MNALRPGLLGLLVCSSARAEVIRFDGAPKGVCRGWTVAMTHEGGEPDGKSRATRGAKSALRPRPNLPGQDGEGQLLAVLNPLRFEMEGSASRSRPSSALWIRPPGSCRDFKTPKTTTSSARTRWRTISCCTRWRTARVSRSRRMACLLVRTELGVRSPKAGTPCGSFQRRSVHCCLQRVEMLETEEPYLYEGWKDRPLDQGR
jgi:hypothetical protein